MKANLQREGESDLPSLAGATATCVVEQLRSGSLAAEVAQHLANSPAFADSVSNAVVLEMLLHSAKEQTPYQVFRNVGDEFWFWALSEGMTQKAVLRDLLPGMPPADVQEMNIGESGIPALQSGFEIYTMVRQLYRRHAGQELADCEAILDFGCGWGRVIRFFLRDVESSRLYGTDPYPEHISLGRQTNRWCQFELMDTEPPTPFPDNKFDWIFSSSVFSHLSEEYHHRTLRELFRILKPGGLLMATTHGREFACECEEIRKVADPTALASGVAISLRSFLNPRQALDDYDQGRYCFSSLSDVVGFYYGGDTAISEAYVKQHWTKLFTFVDYVSHRQVCAQNVIVMRKERAAGRQE